MIFTARQLEELARNGQNVTLPYRARLTPLAQDWVRHKKIAVGYADVETQRTVSPIASEKSLAPSWMPRFLWWCDGPCGPAKAALMSQARESNIAQSTVANEPTQIVAAIRALADEIKTDRAAGGILLVKNGAAGMIYANRCPSLRAILGTCIDAVEQGVREMAANLLVIEHPYQSLSQVKNLLGRFVRGKRELSEAVRARLKELATCG